MRQVTVASGKGGTGKTTLSLNLAAYLSEINQDVVLADADVEEPNSALYLKPKWEESIVATKAAPVWDEQKCVLCNQCASYCHFNAIMALPSEILVFPKLCHSCYACSQLCFAQALPMEEFPMGEIKVGSSMGFTCIEGRLDVGQEMATPLIAKTIQKASTIAKEWLIVDAPPGSSCSFLESIKQSQIVLLVTEPTPFGLHDLKAAVEATRALGKSFGVVLNRVGIGDSKVLEYCENEKIPIVAKIPHDEMIAKSCARGELVFQKVEDFKKALEDISQFLGEER
jgi:MinD superfamily P-loop ATPase